jgi:hypothetical protein
MKVFVIVAVNNADFDSRDIIVVGTSLEKAEFQLQKVLKDKWLNHLDKDDLDFYKTEENYIGSWVTECAVCGLAE